MNKNEKKLNKLKLMLVKASTHKNYTRQFYEIIQHKIAINVNPLDYYRYEFYKEGQTLEQKSRYVILGGSRYWPFGNNPYKFTISLSDKYIQKALLTGFGLPTPTLFATVGDNFDIKTQVQLSNFLDRNDQNITIKPISSAQGKNIIVVTKRDYQYFLRDKPITYDEIWQYVSRDMINGCLLEENIVNLPSVAEIYPLCLNTFRIVTIKTNDNKWHVGASIFKFGRGGSFVDNGMAGGIITWVDSSGKIIDAFDCLYHKPIAHHPDSGVNLVGIKIEGFHQVKALALKASEKFCFMGTIGWDIAYTDKGAMIIEGNTSWGPDKMQQLGKGGIINDELAKGLRRHHMFSLWDKDNIYPAFFKRRWWSWNKLKQTLMFDKIKRRS